MNMWKILAGISLATVSSASSANIPAEPLPEKGWDGPGHLCEYYFTLRIEQDEYVVEDVQLEPWYPASNTVKSSDGWYWLATLDDDRARRHKMKQIRVNSAGTVYQFQPDDDLAWTASFVFVPRKRSKPPIEIRFFRADQPSPFSADWRVTPQKSYDPDRYGDVLDRIDFLNAPQADCLNQ